MKEILLFVALGLGAGSAYAIIGSGIAVIHRGSGVVNFAQGAMAMLAALQYAEFTNRGWSKLQAFVVVAILAAVFGVLIQLLVMRPLRDAPNLARLVATLGIVLVAQAVAAIHFGTASKFVESLVPNDRVTVLGVKFGEDRLYVAGIAIFLALLLMVITRWTKFGALLRAGADSERGVALLGYSPDLLAGATWVIGSVLAAIGGMCVVSITSTDSVALTLLVIPALAAALLGRFSNFGLIAVAGLGIGIGQSLLTKYEGTYGIPSGARGAAPFAVVMVAMVLQGSLIPNRTVVREGRAPIALSGRARLPVVCAAIVIPLGVLSVVSAKYQAALTTSMVAVIVTLSVVVVTGWVGQISLAQMAFAGLGALFASKLASGAGLPFLLSVPLSAVLVVPVGLLIGLPSLRVRGVSLAIVTLGGAVAVYSTVFTNQDVTGGLDGTRVPRPSLFGFDVNAFTQPFRYGVVVLAVVVLCIFGAAWLRRSAIGLRMLAVRDNERAACAEGINVARTKLLAFVIGSFLAGLAGALYGYQQGVVAFERFNPFASIVVVGLAYIAGVGALSGSVFAGITGAGGVVVVLLGQFDKIDQYQNLIAGLGVLLIAIRQPDGVMPELVVGLRRLGSLFKRTAAAEVAPELPGAQDQRSTSAPVLRDRPRSALDVSDPPRSALFTTVDLSVRYGSVVALDRVSIEVPPAHLIGLIGPNGAGKSTFIDAVTGFTPATGAITFAGRRLDGVRVHQRARMGLRRTFQSIELFEDLTVEENLLLGPRKPVEGSPHAVELSPHDVVEILGLGDIMRRMPTELSNGERKLVGVARALIGHPLLVLLDEPAAGLDTRESEVFGEHLIEITRAGVAVLLVDHDLDLIMNVSDHVYVLDRGRVIADGPPTAIRDDKLVRTAYVGDVPAEDHVLSELASGAV